MATHTNVHTHSDNFFKEKNGEVGEKLRNNNNYMLWLPWLMFFFVVVRSCYQC